jgi:5-methylcytosine-specific restriction endonuclease McrA
VVVVHDSDRVGSKLSDAQVGTLDTPPAHVKLDLPREIAKRFAATVPTDNVRAVAVRLWQIGDGVCPLCETDINILLRHPHAASAQVDHVTPKSLGGGDNWGNLRVTHRQCNMERNDARRGELTPENALELLRRGVHRHDHPLEYLPQEIESERRVLEIPARFLAEAKAAYEVGLNTSKVSLPSLEYLRKRLKHHERQYAIQQRKIDRLEATLVAVRQGLND